ncbi:PucR family transcriptional regulator [Gordonia asplenii]|nr:helix-turn-helix domain-containing protein [Gordonia asplenii]
MPPITTVTDAELAAELSEIADLMNVRLGSLSRTVAETIARDVDFYASTDVVPIERITETVRHNFEFVISGMRGDEAFDTTPARITGTDRASRGVPLTALMHAYRIGFQMVWREFMAVAQDNEHFSRRAVLAATERMWLGQDAFIVAMASAHREQTTSKILDDAAERAALTEHLLEGRVTSQTSLWEIAAHLRIPTRGPYLAIAATAPTVGKQPLPGVDAKMRALDLYSAWRLLPDQQIGIVHAPSAASRASVLELLSRIAVGRVGVSAPFAELADTAKALRYARVAVNGPGSGVTQFDDSVLGIAAVSTPEVSLDVANTVLSKLYALPDDDREPLFDTFRTWVDAGGNINTTAERMFVHRNTVRHRLRRIEELSGRSTTAPRELAELCLAFEVDAHFPASAGDLSHTDPPT